MMLKTVTLPNAAQTHWRLLRCTVRMGLRLRRCVWHRCVSSFALPHTHTNLSLSITQLWCRVTTFFVYINQEHIPRQLLQLWSSALARHVLQVSLCCWGRVEAQAQTDGPWPWRDARIYYHRFNSPHNRPTCSLSAAQNGCYDEMWFVTVIPPENASQNQSACGQAVRNMKTNSLLPTSNQMRSRHVTHNFWDVSICNLYFLKWLRHMCTQWFPSLLLMSTKQLLVYKAAAL